jgi:hypothetical protein
MGNGVSREIVNNYNYPVGFGYVTIPGDVDRKKYIETCLRKERIDIKLDDGGGVIQECYIDMGALQRIIFPEDTNTLGSCVAFITPRFYNKAIIVGVVSKSDETQLLDEKSFKKVVNSDSAAISIEGKGQSGELFINVESLFENEGNIFINLKSKNNSSKFNVRCFGDINLYSEGEVSLKSLNSIKIESFRIEENEEKFNSEINIDVNNLYVKDRYGNQLNFDENGNINILPDIRCNLFQGLSPLVRGDILLKELNKSKDRIDSIIEALKAGAGASSTSTTYSTAVMGVIDTIITEEDYKDINSEKSFTD